MMNNKNYSYIILGLLFSAFLFSACSVSTGSDPRVPEGALARNLVDMEQCTFKANKIKYQAECGSLVVSENRSDPGARLITLPLMQVRALRENPAEPIFWLTGGPGNSNMGLSFRKGLISNHDIVFVGYRGVDGSSRLECLEIGKAATGLGNELFSNPSLENFGAATAQCAERLQSEGFDLDGYSVPEVVEDMEDARTALGYERVNLLSGSYGTRVAMIYSWMHPERLKRSAMIAVNPPGHFVWEPNTIDALIAYDAALCIKDTDCSTRTDDLSISIRNTSEDMPNRWLILPIDPGKVVFITQFMLYHRATAATVFDAYLAAETGDPSELALMSLAYDLMIPSLVTWGDWMAKGSIDYDPSRDWLTDMNQPDSIMGSPTSLLVGGAAQLNGGWPVAPMPEAFHSVQPSDVETLLINGSIDCSTPAQFATEELLPMLSNGKEIILSELGHFIDLWGSQPEVMDHLLATFFGTGEVDHSLFTYQPMVFDIKLGFPLLAKLLVLIVVLLIVGLILLIRSIIRRKILKKEIKQNKRRNQ
jgi:pimeloyl-ACP methyl ester carboxylesterase